MEPTPNIQHVWARLLIDELVRAGVGLFCLAPGSRSTPLTVAVAEHAEATHLIHFDERGTAFAALGYARATGRPAAWITTSGTAVANGLPAVVEAATEGVPMILLTADRPPELRATDANQTIDQVKLFGSYVRWQVDLPVPTTAIDPAFVLTTVDQAVHRAMRVPQGPVHLNCMFREPLAPESNGVSYDGYLAPLAAWHGRTTPYTTYTPTTSHAQPHALAALMQAMGQVERGLIVTGALHTTDEAEAALRIARFLGWPLLPDVRSGLRTGAPEATAYYDLLLADAAFAEQHAPDAVLHLGGRSLSKRLMQYLIRHRPARYAVVRPWPERLDPQHQVTDYAEATVEQAYEALRQQGTPSDATSAWQDAWETASHHAHDRLNAFFDASSELSEPLVARLVSQHLPEGHGLALASSMPVRDMDAFADAQTRPVRAMANRGASGIDGTVATAVGYARGLEAPTTLLIGDLALLHDLNSLALLKTSPQPLVIVVVNNDGGGIFHFLPIARHERVFEPYFGTPHGLTFAQAAALFGVHYAHPRTPDAFIEAYTRARGAETSTLIEVTTDREANRTLHAEILRFMHEAG